METTPDYKALLGKKILKLRPLGYDTEIQIGDPVMIFEGMVQTFEYRLSNIQALRELGYSELQWRIAPVNRQTLIKMYRDGIHSTAFSRKPAPLFWTRWKLPVHTQAWRSFDE
jgi:hypothetical protein